jgi:Na+-driven multidrug efflux pump
LNLVILVVVLRRGVIPNIKLPLKLVRVDRALAIELFRVGWPAAIDMLILNAGFLSALGMLARIDEVTVAAHGLGMRVQSLAFVPGLSIAQATAAMIGQALGASNVQRAREIVRSSLLLCLAIMCALALAIIFAAYPLSHIFDVKPDTHLEAYTVEWMRILGYAMVPSAIHIALVGLLQGSGATRTSLRLNLWTTIIVQIPVAYVLGFVCHLDALGVWLSFPISFAVRAMLYFIAYKREKWAVTGVRIPTPAASAEH